MPEFPESADSGQTSVSENSIQVILRFSQIQVDLRKFSESDSGATQFLRSGFRSNSGTSKPDSVESRLDPGENRFPRLNSVPFRSLRCQLAKFRKIRSVK